MSYVIACSKIWDHDLIDRLKEQVKTNFYLVTDKNQLTIDFLNKVKAEKIFFPHWSHIIKPEVFNQFECIIFHMTDLPYGRGGSPLQNLIARGHKETKISALLCTKEIDAGLIYLKEPLSLDGTAQEIFKRATKKIEKMIVDIITLNPKRTAQVGEVVLFERRKAEESNLKPLNDLEKIYDYIRMLDADGYPNAFIENNGVYYEFSSVKWKGNELEAKVRIIKK